MNDIFPFMIHIAMLQFFPKGKSRVAALQNPCCRPASYSMKDLRWAISSLSMPCDEK